MNTLEKLQGLPAGTRKIICWAIVIIFGIGLLGLWIKDFQQKIKSFSGDKLKGQFQIPSLERELKNLPGIGAPKTETPGTLNEGTEQQLPQQ